MRILAVTFLFMSACSFREDKLGNEEERIARLRPWFSNLNANLIQPKCYNCHYSSAARGKIDLSSYEAILKEIRPGNPEASRLYTSIAGVRGTMPLEQKPLSAREIKIIADWIRTNAPMNEGEGSDNTPPPPPEPEPTFAWLDENIFQTRCLGCHDGPGGEGGVNMKSYETWATDMTLLVPGSPEESFIYEITDPNYKPAPMPKGRPLLSESERALIYQWIKKGAPKKEE